MSTTTYCAAVVKWPLDWKPASWQDIPPRVEVLEVVQRSLSFSDVVNWVRRYNHTALASSDRAQWGVILTSSQVAPAVSERSAAAPRRQGHDDSTLERPAPRDGRYGLA